MRSVPAGSFERLTCVEALWRAWGRCRRGKRQQAAIARFEIDADLHVVRLSRALRAGAYRPGRHRLQVVIDPKTRLVAAPPVIDRVVHEALLSEIGPTYERGMIRDSYAVGVGRGVHRAVLAYLGWTRRARYRLSLDVRRYFPSVRHDTLCALFARRLRDRRTLALIERLIDAGGEVYRTPAAARVLGLDADPVPPDCGLPLGGYLSHWSGGLYLDALDHFIKRERKVRGYLRYMDDMVLFGDDASRLADDRAVIGEWLRRERGLALKRPEAPVVPTTQPSTFLGYRISRAGVSPGPKAKRRLKARLRDADAVESERLARSLAAYRGLLLTL